MEDCNKIDEPWFTAVILESPEDPVGFQTWAEGITQNKYYITLPDGGMIDARIFMDHQQIFDNGSYTNYVRNRYEEDYE